MTNKKQNQLWAHSHPNWVNQKQRLWIMATLAKPIFAFLNGKLPAAPSADASPKEKMAYKLATEIGHAIYRLRKCTVEPVIGIIKEIMGFRQFSLRGLKSALGEWCLVCLAFNLKRMHILWIEQGLY
jgi:hypothetical protein